MQYKHATFLLFVVFIGTGILTVAVFERRAGLSDGGDVGVVDVNLAKDDAVVDASDAANSIELPVLLDGQYRTRSVDLDGDGVNENISATFVKTQDGVVTTLFVNGTSVSPKLINPQGYFGIVDLDIADGHKEIAISDLGPSSDYSTVFYTWKDGALHEVNMLPDMWEHMTIAGDGTVLADARAGVLDTWSYRGVFRLQDGVLAEVPQDFYVHIGAQEVIAQKAMTFQKSPTDSTISLTLGVGEKAMVIGCDHINAEDAANTWCKLADTAEEPNLGWFKLGTVDLQADFTGFSFAD